LKKKLYYLIKKGEDKKMEGINEMDFPEYARKMREVEEKNREIEEQRVKVRKEALRAGFAQALNAAGIRRRVALTAELPELEKSYEVAVRNFNGTEERVKNLKKQKEEADAAYVRIKELIEEETRGVIERVLPLVSEHVKQADSRAREAYDVRESIAMELAQANGKEYYPAQDQPVAFRAVEIR